jgi:hypothetical protein
MHLSHFEHDGDLCLGAVQGEGQVFAFVANTADGRVLHLEEIINGERQVVLYGDYPMHLKMMIGPNPRTKGGAAVSPTSWSGRRKAVSHRPRPFRPDHW